MKPTSVTPLSNAAYYGPPPIISGSCTIGVELLRRIQNEVAVLHEQHWQETETGYMGDLFAPDYDDLIQREREYRVILFTVRKDNALVGNLMVFITANPNKLSELQAQENAFYLVPEVRGSGIAAKLLRYAENFLRQCQVKRLIMTDKSPLGGVSLEKFFAKFGLEPIALLYSKRLED